MDQDVYRLTLQEQLDRPYVALLEPTSFAKYSQDELKSLRSAIEQERDQQIEACKKEEERLRGELDAARKQLKELNKSSSRDTRSMAGRRADIHIQIAAFEHTLRNKKMEREHIIPAAFEIKLAKLRLVEHWPERHEEIARSIEEGRARERKHGDIDDIGYRKIVKDQEKDVAAGEQAVRQMTSSGLMPREVQAADVQQYVQRLAGKIAENSDLKVPLHVTVVDSSEIYAIAVPGGFLFVSSGLILAAGTEAEFAGVLSHEIARIAARHGTRASQRSVISKMFVPAAQVATGLFTGGVTNAGAYYGMNYGFQGLNMLVDRALVGASGKYQKEADQLGIQYAWKAGFDSKGFIAFLDSIAQAKQYTKTASFFRTTPKLGERLVDAFSEIEYLPAKEGYIVDSAEFRKAKERLE
jgi:hypothetical protein